MSFTAVILQDHFQLSIAYIYGDDDMIETCACDRQRFKLEKWKK